MVIVVPWEKGTGETGARQVPACVPVLPSRGCLWGMGLVVVSPKATTGMQKAAKGHAAVCR